MYRYRLYGLLIDTPYPIAGVSPYPIQSHVLPDVTVEFDTLPTSMPDLQSSLVSFTPNEIKLYYPQTGCIIIKHGTHIHINPQEEHSSFFGALLYGVLIGLILHQRGFMTLHGSSVQMGEVAIGFIANRTYGKSTTVAALTEQGFPLLTDDVMPLSLENNQVMITAGLPRVRLWVDAIEHLFPDTVSVQPVYEGVEKHVLPVPFADTRLPLKCLYILEWGDRIELETVTGATALVALLPHLYLARWPEPGNKNPQLFRHASDIARHVEIRKLKRPRDLSMLNDVINRIINS